MNRGFVSSYWICITYLLEIGTIFFRFFLSFTKEMFFRVSRYPDGAVRLRNPNIELMDQDILYHLALGSGSHDLNQMFGDVKVSRV